MARAGSLASFVLQTVRWHLEINVDMIVTRKVIMKLMSEWMEIGVHSLGFLNLSHGD